MAAHRYSGYLYRSQALSNWYDSRLWYQYAMSLMDHYQFYLNREFRSACPVVIVCHGFQP